MQSRIKKKLFRSHLFSHLDGIVLIPTIIALEKKNIISQLKKNSINELAEQFNANEAYLNVALRLLASQGILRQIIYDDHNICYENTNSINITSILKTYALAQNIYIHNMDYNSIITDKKNIITEKKLYNTINNYISKKNISNQIQDKHVEGIMLAPLIVLFSRNGFFNGEAINMSLLNNKWHNLIIQLFKHCKLIDNDKKLTEYGLFIFKRASAYGVTVSYLPTYRNIENLIYRDANVLQLDSNLDEEIHVDRDMNVWGSGGAHQTYFKKIDEIILHLFNLPIEKQPKGFIDIGCGNGKFIEHIFDLIYYKTNRGKLLKKHPLFIVGSDFNQQALTATKKTIEKADIWAKAVFGDISNPQKIAEELLIKHKIELSDLLNVRSFLDHNRIYENPKQKIYKKSKSSGAFCHRGKRITSSELQQNLKEHLLRWKPYLVKYGLLIVELHTIIPEIASKNIGKTAITAYDASHGFSDQYIIEYEYFLDTAKEIGLVPSKGFEYTFPSKEIPIVSINRLINA